MFSQKNKRNKRKERYELDFKGITLIALVITNVVLLILAGVSISMLTGNNGILTQAQNAKEMTEKTSEEEKVQLAVIGTETKDNGHSDVLDETNFKSELKKQFENQELDVKTNGDGSFIVTVKDSKRKYYINDDKTVVNSDNIIEIGTKSELENFRNDVNSGNSYEGKAILLTNSIDLEGEDWEPIGSYPMENSTPADKTNAPFKGIFDGCGYEVNNFNIDTTDKVQGLFGLVDSAKIANLGVGENVEISNVDDGAGGVIGYIYNGTKVYNCYSKASVKGNKNVGGVVGISFENNKVLNCYNLGKVEGTTTVGGVLGYLKSLSEIKDCYNEGSVTGSGNWVGGIVGQAEDSSTVETSYNKGSIYGKANNTGGIAGKLFNNSIVESCYNIGKVTGDGDYIGGIVGHIQASNARNCYNTGIIKGDNATEINSVVGRINTLNDSIVDNCYTLERRI